MGKGRKYNKKPMTRLKKRAGEKRRREKVQRKRLMALGMSEAAVAKLDPKAVRTMLKYPVKTKATLARAAAKAKA